MLSNDIGALTARVVRLESAHRRMKLITVTVLLATMAIVCMALGGKPRTIEAERLVILDTHGRARVTIGTPEVSGAAVDMKPDSPVIWLTDEKGRDVAALHPEGLFLARGQGKSVVNLTNGPRGPQLLMYNAEGKLLWSAP